MANWSLPSITDLYTNFLAYLKARDDDATRLNDSRVTAATNVPDYAKRWNDTTKTFQNWLSSAWTSVILSVAGGGTGASTAAGARTNLDVYSKAEADAAFTGVITTAENQLTGSVSLTTEATWYDGPTVSLSAGTWFIVGNLCFQFPTSSTYGEGRGKMTIGGTDYATGSSLTPGTAWGPLLLNTPLHDIVVLGSTETLILKGLRYGGTSSTVLNSSYSYVRAIKIA